MKKLYRSRTNKLILGVCGGIAERFSFNPWLVRLLFLSIGLLTGILPLVGIYLLGWVFMPQAPLESGNGN
ncbi:MAG: PspC domain-containing protein [Dehalococcoidia bacterium]|nr:PspC domain-containing protein [Chloroflexota bacterium]MCZ6866046.1 PspC domain-containing protein [Chloroflexota bacterium]